MYPKMPLLDDALDGLPQRTNPESSNHSSTRIADSLPKFTQAEMWLCYELEDNGDPRDNPKLLRPLNGIAQIKPKGDDPFCYMNVSSNIDGGDILILLASHGVSVCRASDYAVLGFFPATGEQVIT